MTYKDLYEKAEQKLEKGEITSGEFDKMTKPLDEEIRPHGEWKEESDGYDVRFRCSHCGTAIHALNKTNHERLKALTGGKWWTHYRYCPICGSDNRKEGVEK